MMNADTENNTTIETSNDVNAENSTIAQDTDVILSASSEPSLTDSSSSLPCTSSSSSSTSIVYPNYIDTEMLLYQTFSIWAEFKVAQYHNEHDHEDAPIPLSPKYFLYKKILDAKYEIISSFFDIYNIIKTDRTVIVLKDKILEFIDFAFYFIDSLYLQDEDLIAFGFYKDLVIIGSLQAIKSEVLIHGPMVLASLINALSNQIDSDIKDQRVLSQVLYYSNLPDDLMACIIMRGMQNKFILDTAQKGPDALATLSSIAAVLRHKNNTYHTAHLLIFHLRENRQPGITTLAEALTHDNCRLTQLSLLLMRKTGAYCYKL